jgi:hypothetical protein
MTIAVPGDDDPLALPLDDATVLLDPLPDAREAADLVAQTVRALRQQLAELGLALPLQELPGDRGAPASGRLLRLAGHRVQLVCAPFWCDVIAVPPEPWRPGGEPIQFLLAAWVEPDHGAVRLPGVLTAAELAQRLPDLARSSEPCVVPHSAFRGGAERLFSLARLLPPVVVTSSPVVHALDWLDGVLTAALEVFGAELVPAAAGAFRSHGGAEASDALAAVAIPLALVHGRLGWGAARDGASERFQLRLSLHGPPARPQWLELRLEPALPGDLLPPALTLKVGTRAASSGSQGSTRPLVLAVAASSEPISIVLEHRGLVELQLPPIALLPT